MFKPFFYHYNKGTGKLPNRNPRGFTAHFKPVDLSKDSKELVSSNMIWMSIAWCSSKDEFNKKIGREQVMCKEYKLVNTREVPGYIAGAQNIVNGCYKTPWFFSEKDFYWLFKYFL